jgi:hypothetical protein
MHEQIYSIRRLVDADFRTLNTGGLCERCQLIFALMDQLPTSKLHIAAVQILIRKIAYNQLASWNRRGCQLGD